MGTTIGLTAREREVARMIAQGLSTRGIAAALAVSTRTVEWHVANILRKRGLHSRIQIAVWALQDQPGHAARNSLADRVLSIAGDAQTPGVSE